MKPRSVCLNSRPWAARWRLCPAERSNSGAPQPGSERATYPTSRPSSTHLTHGRSGFPRHIGPQGSTTRAPQSCCCRCHRAPSLSPSVPMDAVSPLVWMRAACKCGIWPKCGERLRELGLDWSKGAFKAEHGSFRGAYARRIWYSSCPEETRENSPAFQGWVR